jgi:hypothetical protein
MWDAIQLSTHLSQLCADGLALLSQCVQLNSLEVSTHIRQQRLGILAEGAARPAAAAEAAAPQQQHHSSSTTAAAGQEQQQVRSSSRAAAAAAGQQQQQQQQQQRFKKLATRCSSLYAAGWRGLGG